MFMRLFPFDESHIKKVPIDPGVYVIYRGSRPVYVGRSRCNIQARLRCHHAKRGNRGIAIALDMGVPLSFEYACMISVEQAEAVLISFIGKENLYNLRKETDPADWD
jgi:excinuclease UvrABC nuclease subunit